MPRYAIIRGGRLLTWDGATAHPHRVCLRPVGRGEHFLRYDSWSDAVQAALFGHLVTLATDVVNDYRSDLFRDAQWILEHVKGPMTFYYGVRDCGTSIGTDLATSPRFTVSTFTALTWSTAIRTNQRTTRIPGMRSSKR